MPHRQARGHYEELREREFADYLAALGRRAVPYAAATGPKVEVVDAPPVEAAAPPPPVDNRRVVRSHLDLRRHRRRPPAGVVASRGGDAGAASESAPPPVQAGPVLPPKRAARAAHDDEAPVEERYAAAVELGRQSPGWCEECYQDALKGLGRCIWHETGGG